MAEIAGPFQVCDGNTPVYALLDRLDNAGICDRSGISLALDFELEGHHGQRYIHRQNEFDVNNFVLCIRADGRGQHHCPHQERHKSKRVFHHAIVPPCAENRQQQRKLQFPVTLSRTRFSRGRR